MAASCILIAPSAFAAGGITPISPKRGDSVPAGKRPTFKMQVKGQHNGVFVHVCKSPKKDSEGLICSKESIGKARRTHGSSYAYKARFFDFPEFWLNNPGTYYWQAHRISCEQELDDCRIEGPVVKFKVS